MSRKIVSFYYPMSRDANADFQLNLKLTGALSRLGEMFRIEIGPPTEEGENRIVSFADLGTFVGPEFARVTACFLKDAGLPRKARVHVAEAERPLEEAVEAAGARIATRLESFFSSMGDGGHRPGDRYIMTPEIDRYAREVLATAEIYTSLP